MIAPPKDIVIPSAGVDVEHGTEFVHENDHESGSDDGEEV